MFGLAMALIFLMAAVGVVFFAPLADLVRNGGGRNRGGNMFLGWVMLFGEPVARAILGTLSVGLAWLFFRMWRH